MLGDALHAATARLASHQIEDARLDAELLLAEACGFSRAQLLAHLSEPLSDSAARQFAEFLARRAQHEPVAYILGRKEFYGLEFQVDPRVLIPRPETELLVECALAWLKQHRERKQPTVIEIGTGSGALAIALALHARATIVAADISSDALAVARDNAARHAVAERITFVHSDLLANVRAHADLMVANLPYVSRGAWDALAPDIAQYEPRGALDGGADGLEVFRRFFAQAPSQLAPHGAIMVEIGATQAEAVGALARAAIPHAAIAVQRDLAGLDRVVIVQM